jgi:predicted alpha/beta superfamily hydrolase
MLDGNAAFGTMTEAVAMQSARTEATGVAPALVVGIGYQTSDLFDPLARTFDYTPEVDRAALSRRPDGSEWPPTGGAAAFLDFIEDELTPVISVEFFIDRTRKVLFGHSFGGLLTLYALFHRPSSFQSYIAASPSIWFGDRAILAAEREFTGGVHDLTHDLRLMIAVGGLEQTLSQQELEMPGGSPRVPWIEKNRMVDNALEMAERLERLQTPRLQVAYEELPGENHASVVPALVGRALRFALAPAR